MSTTTKVIYGLIQRQLSLENQDIDVLCVIQHENVDVMRYHCTLCYENQVVVMILKNFE